MTPDRNHLIGSVAGTLQMLEILGESGAPLALAQVATRSKRAKSTVHRMLSSLVYLGFVAQDPDSRYRLTLKLWRLGVSVFSSLDLVKVARPHLEALMRAADETVLMAMLDPSGGITYVAKVDSPRSVRVQIQLGGLTPSWCTSTGRALLAWAPEVRDKVLRQRLEAFTPTTTTDPDRVRSAIAQVAKQGYAVVKAEHHPELGGVAAPIRDFTGNVVASCGVAIPLYRLDAALIRKSATLVLHAADAISTGLGYLHPPRARTKHAA